MNKENNGVEELYEELENALHDDSVEEEPTATSGEKPTEEVTPSESIEGDEDAELTEEEISKLSPRAQKRFKKLADQVKASKTETKPEEETPEVKPEEKPEVAQPFKTVKDFIDAIQDEDTRNLLMTLTELQKKELASTLAPVEAQKNAIEFEKQFDEFKDLEGIGDYKDDLLMTYQRDPSKSVKTLVAETLLELNQKKVAPSVDTASKPNHDGVISTEGMGLDELYDTIEAMKE